MCGDGTSQGIIHSCWILLKMQHRISYFSKQLSQKEESKEKDN